MSHTHDHSHGPAHSHSHSHSHSHGHEDGHDFSKANAEHFDKTAAQYDEEAKIDVVTRIAEKIRGAYSFDPERTSMLDFACGTGLVSRMLEPYTRKIVGVDISQGMVDVYNARMAERGVAPERAFSAVRDVLKEPFQTGWQTYDVIVCSMAYHHFASITDTTKALVPFLNAGGVLLVADLMPPKHETTADPMIEEKYHAMVAHRHGFDEATMRSTFEVAGLSDFTYAKAADMTWDGKDLEIFLATASKKA